MLPAATASGSGGRPTAATCTRRSRPLPARCTSWRTPESCAIITGLAWTRACRRCGRRAKRRTAPHRARARLEPTGRFATEDRNHAHGAPMTVWAFVADVHGNYKALVRAEARAREQGAERFVLLGDLLGRGQPAECVAWARAHVAL